MLRLPYFATTCIALAAAVVLAAACGSSVELDPSAHGGGGAPPPVGGGGSTSVVTTYPTSTSTSTAVATQKSSVGRTGKDPGVANPYGHTKYGFTGSWTGTATWADLGKSWPVRFEFKADGSYEGHSLDPNQVALYYGSDDDVAGKTYSIDDLQASGDGLGTIRVYFFVGDWNTGDLKNIALSADLTHLSFDFWKGGNGPIHYDLDLVSP